MSVLWRRRFGYAQKWIVALWILVPRLRLLNLCPVENGYFMIECGTRAIHIKGATLWGVLRENLWYTIRTGRMPSAPGGYVLGSTSWGHIDCGFGNEDVDRAVRWLVGKFHWDLEKLGY